MNGKNLNVIQDFKHNTINGHEYVDLGLASGLKWATCNVGASLPEKCGDYYAWAEVETKSTYSGENCVTYGKNMSDISGNTTYDVARKKWGSSWRLPTRAEFQELLDKCKWEWTTQGGKEGYKVIGPNGNSIFLPAAGCRLGSDVGDRGYYGHCWSGSLNSDYSYMAYYLDFGDGDFGWDFYYRYLGLSVRPVSE